MQIAAYSLFKRTFGSLFSVFKEYLVLFYRHGPLVRHWCMRFEAKHHYFEKLAHGMTNFKNLSITLAMRHQHLQCYWLSKEDSYHQPVTDPGSEFYSVCIL